MSYADRRRDAGLAIQLATADHYGLTLAAMLRREKTWRLLHARQLAMLLCRKRADLTLDEIAALFGFSFTTCSACIVSAEARVKGGGRYAKDFAAVCKALDDRQRVGVA